MVKLSQRLLTIAEMIEPGETIADIGTDHGLLPIFLYKKGICQRAALCDINQGPLLKAKLNIEHWAPEADFEILLGDGLIPLEKGAWDTAVIAGMGGRLIASILHQDPDKSKSFRKLILQPRNAADKLRMYLYRQGYAITEERLAGEGRHVCEIFSAVYAPQNTTMEEREAAMMGMAGDLVFEVSPQLLARRDPLLPALIRQKLRVEREILQEIYRGGGGKDSRLTQVLERVSSLSRLLKIAEEHVPETPESVRIEVLDRTYKRRRLEKMEGKKMAMSFSDFLQELRSIAPRELEEEWDNGGMQIEMSRGEVRKVLVALEVTNRVIDEAVDLGVDYIVCHHPLLFHKLDVIDGSTITGNYIIRLIQNGISVYAAHTSFDAVFGGNNDYLAEMVGLTQIRRLKYRTAFGYEEEIGRLGIFEDSMTLEAAGKRVAAALDMPQVKMVGDPNQTVRTVGVCTGAGGSSLDAVLRNRCDLYISGDIKYHEAQTAKEMGLCIIDAGHYGTEKIFVENFAAKLRKAVREKIEIFESKVNVNPFDS